MCWRVTVAAGAVGQSVRKGACVVIAKRYRHLGAQRLELLLPAEGRKAESDEIAIQLQRRHRGPDLSRGIAVGTTEAPLQPRPHAAPIILRRAIGSPAAKPSHG